MRKNEKRLKYRNISLINKKADITLSARVLHTGFSDETWSV